MQSFELEHQEAIAVDEATKAAIEAAQREVEQGHTISLEEAEIIVRKQYQLCQKTQEVLTA